MNEYGALRDELAAAYAELRKLWAGHPVIFDRDVYNRAMEDGERRGLCVEMTTEEDAARGVRVWRRL